MASVFAVPGRYMCDQYCKFSWSVSVPFHSKADFMYEITVFFIVFRETIETSIIVAVLLALIKQTLGGDHQSTTHTKLVRQVRLSCSIQRE